MIVARKWMTHFLKRYFALNQVALAVCLLTLASCNPTEITSSGQRAAGTYGGDMYSRAYIYRESPAITHGQNYGPDVDMSGSVDRRLPEFITDKTLLKGDCSISLYTGSETLSDCIHAYASKTASQQLLPRKADGTWIFPTNSAEFYQVNALYHVQHGVDTFFDKLKFAYETLYFHPALNGKMKSTPMYLLDTNMYWFRAITPSNDNYFRNSFLSTYALCNLELNAQFSPAGPDLCFGKWSAHPSFFFVQDPSVIYHELGHALISLMMNFRNATPTDLHPLRSNLGGVGYDEAGSLGEGIADYYSFVMNKRTHFGEWALGKSFNASRPMSEDDSIHISGIDTSSEGRLSYPQYLLYDPNDPNVPFEDVHYAGQIVSHYLVALTKSLQNECGIPNEQKHDISTSYVMMLLAETLSEIGDLKSVGFDTSWGSPQAPNFVHRFNNLNENDSYVWSHVVNPPTYRRFFQVMSKNILKFMSQGLCSGFTQDESEKLLDDYGLLLFKTYNDNGSSTTDSQIQYNQNGLVVSPMPMMPATPVHENNRRKSVLVSKQLLSMATPNVETNTVTYYVIDDQPSMTGILKNILFKGFPMNPSPGIAGVEYNNGNIQISPGEIVAVIPNLYNASNSPMAGVHLLANDWDHVSITDTTGENGYFKPCVVDDVTTVAQGAEANGTCASTLNKYTRHVKREVTPATLTEPAVMKFRTDEAVAPVCLVQLAEIGQVTRWVSQNEFRKKQDLAMQDKDCLGFGGTEYTDDFTFNPHECLVRVLPGANRAFYSRIDPRKSYAETMRNGNPDHTFGVGNAILFEVNKWIPPGTKFRCRLRAKFSNCSDCFTDPNDPTKDDFIDAEYNGAKPFKVINFEFDVND